MISLISSESPFETVTPNVSASWLIGVVILVLCLSIAAYAGYKAVEDDWRPRRGEAVDTGDLKEGLENVENNHNEN